jgi:enoyl-CoA hydratase
MTETSTGALVRSWSQEGVGRIHLDDAAHRNVLSKQMSDAIAAAVAERLANDVGALVLTAEPPVFCAGGSLDSLLARDRPLSDFYAGQLALADSPVPTIAAVEGPVIGAGVNLPLACDVVIAGPDARFDPRFLDVGIHPGGGHLWRLRQRVGDQGAAALVICGDVLDGAEAAAAGLAWRCVPAGEAEARAVALAERAVGRSRDLVVRTKQTLRASAGLLDPSSAVALELEAQQWSVEQPGFLEAVERMKQQVAERRRSPK